jgi:hypothetical protein
MEQALDLLGDVRVRRRQVVSFSAFPFFVCSSFGSAASVASVSSSALSVGYRAGPC